MKADDIKVLIEGCINKDELSWSKFINCFSSIVKWSVTDRLKRWSIHFNTEDVEDIRQQVFLSIWEKNRLIELRARTKIEAWLTIVAGNFAFNYMRNRSRIEPPTLESIFRKDLRIEDIADSKDTYLFLEGSEIKTIINNFIEKLPPHQKTILMLNYFYGKKHREIADMLKIPVNTVSTIIKRAKDSLRKELKAKGFVNF